MLNNFFDLVVGFRSRNKRNMIIASIYYILFFIISISSGQSCLFSIAFFFLIPVCIFAVIDTVRNKAFKNLLKIPVCFVLMILSANTLPDTTVLPEKIILETDSVVFEDVSEIQTVLFTVEPPDADILGIQLVSDDDNIASFNENELAAISEGETEIYAILTGTDIKSKSVKVVVKDKQAELERKVKAVEDKIGSLGSITLDSKPAIEEAEEVYNEAESDVQEKVSNYQVLADAKETYVSLEKEAAEKAKIKQEAAKKAEHEASQNSKNDTPQKSLQSNTANSHSSSKSNNSTAKSNSISAAADSSVASSGRTVYVGNTGTKYHKQSCRTLKGNGHAISYDTAISQGRTACKVCGG